MSLAHTLTVFEALHLPVDFMDSPVSIEQMNAREGSDDMAAVLSIDTTKGNRVLNVRGFALSPTVKEGWILKVAPDLVRLAETSSGKPAVCATGASHEVDIAEAVRFVIEVAKEVGAGTCRFYDEHEFARLVALYGDMRRLQGGGAT